MINKEFDKDVFYVIVNISLWIRVELEEWLEGEE